MKRIYEVRVNHESGLFSFYKLEAFNSDEAEKKAKKLFSNDFCGCMTDKKKLDALTINNPDKYDSISNFMNIINANL